MKNQIYEHIKAPENEGISIWHYVKGRNRP